MNKLKQLTIEHGYKLIQSAILRNGGSKKKAGDELGIDRKTLYNKIQAHKELVENIKKFNESKPTESLAQIIPDNKSK